MPTVLRIGPYRFHFYSRENNEPPHIHVARDDCEAKFWLETISLAGNFGFAGHELQAIHNLVCIHQSTLISAWSEYHGQA